MAGTVGDCGGLVVRFGFDDPTSVYSSVPPHQREEFTALFCQEVFNVNKWFVDKVWILPGFSTLPRLSPLGSYSPQTDLQVFVSGAADISEALVPSWMAQRGRMQFPAKEVIVGAAAVTHELTHVYFPNGNRMLAEGLAVYLQYKIGTNQAFPNFGRGLHQLVRDFTCRHGVFPDGLEGIDLVKLDRIATPDILWLRVGLVPTDNAAYVYPVAGSFVQYLIETYGSGDADARMATFRSLYMKTPLVPLERYPGRVERWTEAGAYNVPLADIEKSWKLFIQSNTKCPSP